MRSKIYIVLNKVYATLLLLSFVGGILPIIPFVIAVIVGGATGEKISLFLYHQFYPWVIAGASISVLIGLVALYIEKKP